MGQPGARRPALRLPAVSTTVNETVGAAALLAGGG
ncbi:hypothetical protein QFZ24_005222 [Streptomyces phaeochromogenes]|nr:hypothetical protein [Streptomyces phaeochromogenes]